MQLVVVLLVVLCVCNRADPTNSEFFLVPSVQHYTKIVASEGETTITQTCNNTLINTTFLTFPGDWNFTNAYIDPVTYCTIESDKPILIS